MDVLHLVSNGNSISECYNWLQIVTMLVDVLQLVTDCCNVSGCVKKSKVK